MKRLCYLCLILPILLIYARPSSGAPLSSGICFRAPAPLLHEGVEGIVLIDGLNLRALPAIETGINGRLYRNNPFTVIGGPSCNGQYTWWWIELANGTRGWVAEGTTRQYYVIPADHANDVPTPVHVTCLLTSDPVACL